MLVLSDAFDENTYRAARNVRPVTLATATDVNTEQLLCFRQDFDHGQSARTNLRENHDANERPFRHHPDRIANGEILALERETQQVSFPSRAAGKQDSDQAAIEKLFNKKVVAVNTSNYAGKKKRERSQNFGRRTHWKKAIVTLKEGNKIELV